MDQKKILILNLSKGRIGEDNSALIGAMMITKIQLAAMARVDISEDDRQDFYLYVDEFQNFATESFANILSEARKYRLNLILANQYITQLEEPVRDAIFGNAGTLISFRVGAADAEFLEKELEPVFTMNDLVNLPKYNIYLKLMIDGIAGDAFSATTLPPIAAAEGDSTEKVIAVSRERYSRDKKSVEEKIARWSGVVVEGEYIPPKQDAPAPRTISAPQPPQKKPQRPPRRDDGVPQTVRDPKKPAQKPAATEAQQPERTLYDAVCETCEEEISVPFKPDGTRPTFCKECLKDYQRALAKTRQSTEEGAPQQKKPPKPKKPRRDHTQISNRPAPAQKTEELKSYVPQEAPLSLSQMKNIAPKKFGRSTPKIDLAGVRDMIKDAKD